MTRGKNPFAQSRALLAAKLGLVAALLGLLATSPVAVDLTHDLADLLVQVIILLLAILELCLY